MQGLSTHDILAYLTGLSPTVRRSPAAPQQLLIYQGTPERINSAINCLQAAKEYEYYDIVVLIAPGLHLENHPSHKSVKKIIGYLKQLKPSLLMLGCVDLGVSMSNYTTQQLATQIDTWMNTLGAGGVLLDDVAYEHKTSRARQNGVIEYIHSKGGVCMVTCPNPDDVFGQTRHELNPSGAPSALDHRDYYLSENFVINTESYSKNEGIVTYRHLAHKEALLAEYASIYNVQCVASDCMDLAIDYTQAQELFQAGYLLARMFNKTAYGMHVIHYSSQPPFNNMAFKYSLLTSQRAPYHTHSPQDPSQPNVPALLLAHSALTTPHTNSDVATHKPNARAIDLINSNLPQKPIHGGRGGGRGFAAAHSAEPAARGAGRSPAPTSPGTPCGYEGSVVGQSRVRVPKLRMVRAQSPSGSVYGGNSSVGTPTARSALGGVGSVGVYSGIGTPMWGGGEEYSGRMVGRDSVSDTMSGGGLTQRTDGTSASRRRAGLLRRLKGRA